jgi:hypothetical protein
MNYHRAFFGKIQGVLYTSALLICIHIALVALPADATGIRISPLTFEMTANPGDTISNVIEVFNPEDDVLMVDMKADDFAPIGESGQVVVIEDSNETFSLSKWMTLEPATFALPAHGRQAVTFTIHIPPNGEPGGHYGTVLASVSSGSAGGGSSISQKIGSLLLLYVAGNAREQMWVKSFEVPAFSEGGPITFGTRLENIGTVHLKPYGFITITDIFGRKTTQLSIDAKNVLPNSIRKIDTVWKEDGFLFGRYTATLTAIYGSQNEPLSYVTTFWIIPWKQTAAGAFGTLILLLIFFKMRKRFGTALRIMIKGEKKSKSKPPRRPSSSIRANLTGYER